LFSLPGSGKDRGASHPRRACHRQAIVIIRLFDARANNSGSAPLFLEKMQTPSL
jgi:hypothetical protein